jgi:hypothetical protein
MVSNDTTPDPTLRTPAFRPNKEIRSFLSLVRHAGLGYCHRFCRLVAANERFAAQFLAAQTGPSSFRTYL